MAARGRRTAVLTCRLPARMADAENWGFSFDNTDFVTNGCIAQYFHFGGSMFTVNGFVVVYSQDEERYEVRDANGRLVDWSLTPEDAARRAVLASADSR